MVSDTALLDRYARAQDAEAFAELFRRYARLVYGTCLRVTRDRDDAEDVAQECFLELARKAGSITSSLPGWLHSLARSRSIDALRKASARQRHEAQAAAEGQRAVEPTWSDIAPHVDRALAELPEHLRLPVILHYLEGRRQSQVAVELGINQSTVSRILDKALRKLRDRLETMGVVPSVAALAILLKENAAGAVPQTLTASAGKMAIAGVGKAGGAAGAAAPVASTAGPSALSAALFGTVPAKMTLVLAASAVVFVGATAGRRGPKSTPRVPAARLAMDNAAAADASRADGVTSNGGRGRPGVGDGAVLAAPVPADSAAAGDSYRGGAGPTQAFYLGEDRTTQGDWTGRYGDLEYVLWAIRPGRRDIMGGSAQGLSLGYATTESGWEPIHYPTRFVQHSTEPRYLLNPEARFRSMGELNDWTDHYPENPPDIYIRVDVPEQWHLLSIYWVNNDSGDRRYRVRLESTAGEPLAECTIEEWDQGYYTRFAVRAEPQEPVIVVHISCERGDIIKLSGLFLDEVFVPRDCPVDLGPDRRERGAGHDRPEEPFAGMVSLWERGGEDYFRAYGRYAAAAEALTKAARQGDPYDLWELWQCQRATGEHRAAEQTLGRFADDVVDRLGEEKGHSALGDLVKWFDQRHEPRLAAVVLDRRLRGAQDSPENRDLYRRLAERWFDLCEDLATADALGRLSAFDLPGDELCAILFRTARIYEAWDQPAESERWYRELARRVPDTADGRAAARRIYGFVKSRDSGVAVGDARVALVRQDPPPEGGSPYDSWRTERVAQSDPDGTYEVSHLPAGTYRWQVSASDHYTLVSPPFQIADDERSTRIDLELEPTPTRAE